MSGSPLLDPTHPLAVALAAGRDRYNALFEAARARHDALEGADVLAVLAETVAPLVKENTASATLDALYPIVLDATGRAWIGPSARQPEVGGAWTVALAGCRRQLATADLRFEVDPSRVATALLQAIRTLAKTSGAQPLRWADRLADLSELATSTDALLDAGAVLAWREGLVRLRAAALRASSRLDPTLALAALGVDTTHTPAELMTALGQLEANPWLTPAQAFEPPSARTELAIQAICGGFRGFGGPFLVPPTLVASSSGTVASDGDRWFRLHADVFGTAFERIHDFETDSTGDDTLGIQPDGRLQWGNWKGTFHELARSMSAASTATTLAVVIPNSHRIALIAPSR
ncbi:MAG: hypothetical protein Rubg2KO_37580 [Rubricoccaceae bacterium]